MADAVPQKDSGAGEGQVETPVVPPAAVAAKEETPVTPNSEVAKPPEPENPVPSEAKVENNVVPKENADPVPQQDSGAGEGQVKTPVIPPAAVAAKEETPVTPNSEVAKPPEPENPVPSEAKVENNAAPKENGDWNQRELELLKKIEELEAVKTEVSEDKLRVELKLKEQEVELLKARVISLETELQLALSKPGGAKNQEVIENIKQQHEELLSKARGMIFDKTKMVKNQELQIEALNMQVQSLKDINVITKDLLEIRNSEVKAMEDRLQAMEARFKAEKERYGLVLQKAETSGNLNCDLKKEYQTQLGLFKELRVKYEERVQALMAENNKLKESLKVDPPTET